MIEKTRRAISDDHPIRILFQRLTERGMHQLNLHDSDTIQYITNLLTEFVQIENMYRIKDGSGRRLQYLFDMLTQASNEMSPERRRDCYKHVGDLTLFNLGLFPENLRYTHRTITPNYYSEAGPHSYTISPEIYTCEINSMTTYRNLSQ